MKYCEISGLPIADISPPEFWVVSGGTAYSVHRSNADAIDAICDKWQIKYPTVMFYVEEIA